MWFKGWRTIIVNVLATALPILEASNIINVLPDGWLVYYTVGMAVGNIVLRVITTTPVGVAKEQK